MGSPLAEMPVLYPSTFQAMGRILFLSNARVLLLVICVKGLKWAASSLKFTVRVRPSMLPAGAKRKNSAGVEVLSFLVLATSMLFPPSSAESEGVAPLQVTWALPVSARDVFSITTPDSVSSLPATAVSFTQMMDPRLLNAPSRRSFPEGMPPAGMYPPMGSLLPGSAVTDSGMVRVTFPADML